MAAWGALGPDYTFTTKVAASADGSSLTLCGAGDPSLAAADLEAAAVAVGAFPTAAVRVDASRAGPVDDLVPTSWEWGDLNYYYGTSVRADTAPPQCALG